MVTLETITSKNIWDIIKLSVNDEQKDFVATNTLSLLEAYATISEGRVAMPFGVYDDNTLIGFIMFGYDTSGEEGEPKIAEGNYCIWRFMVDRKYQGKGYGKEALKVALKYLSTMPCGEAEYCWLSYEPENMVAKSLYTNVGFSENGEMSEEEIVAVLKL